MMRLLCLLLLYLLSALAQAFNYRVDIEGLRSSQVELLRSQLDIEAWHDSPEMNLEQLQRLYNQTPERLREVLATWGHFNAEIRAELVQEGSGGPWVARYFVNPGIKAKVGQLDIRFEGAITQADVDPGGAKHQQQLRDSWRLKTGRPFDQEAWREGKKLLLETLSSEKYPWALLKSSQARVTEDGQTVDLQLVFDSGPRVYFGQLRINGLEHYPVPTVSHLNTIEPGTDFNREALLDYQARLIQSGYFSGVLAEIHQEQDLTSSDTGAAAGAGTAKSSVTADILVQVTELRQKQVRLGLGYSTDAEFKASIGYEHRNIFDLGWRWKIQTQADKNNQTLNTEIAFPAGNDLYEDSIGYSYEHDSVGESDTWDNRIYGKRHWGDTRFERTLVLELLDEIVRKQVVSADSINTVRLDTMTVNLNYNWVKRDVNDLVFPTRGLIRDFEGLIGSQFELRPYVRLYARLNHYQPLHRRLQLLTRLELGQVFGTISDVPADYLFRSGGDNTVRGYAYQSIGVKARDTVLGAKTMAVVSAETQYWITGKWGVALFYDAGSLGEHMLAESWYEGYGAGLRWRSPVGPLNLDYAWGRKAEDYQIHLSIGLAF